uniref:Translation initiation factor eIF2B subunit beta n=1 Tax=Setaria digitata TaxID=48799 RepID=A0A915PSS6_9BILA
MTLQKGDLTAGRLLRTAEREKPLWLQISSQANLNWKKTCRVICREILHLRLAEFRSEDIRKLYYNSIMNMVKKDDGNCESVKEAEKDSARRLFIHRQRNGCGLFLYQFEFNSEEGFKPDTFSMQQMSSNKIAYDTLIYIRKIILNGKYNSAEDLIELLEIERKLLLEALPYQFVVSNIILCVIKIICEENGHFSAASRDLVPHDSLNELWKAPKSKKVMDPRELRRTTIMAINEFATEMDNCVDDICGQAGDHICTSDVIITHSLSHSSTLSAFFKSARKSQKSFRLLVVDDEVDYGDCLSSVDILTAMQRATRVFISAVAVFPDGSCLAPAGCLMICLAAKRHAVPVCVCTCFYKFTPFFVADIDRIYSFGSAANVVPFTDMEKMEDAQLVNPLFDLISAELILQYISHTSTFTPSHVYRFIGDYYCRDRIEMSL